MLMTLSGRRSIASGKVNAIGACRKACFLWGAQSTTQLCFPSWPGGSGLTYSLCRLITPVPRKRLLPQRCGAAS